jgi:hypothetical protein
LPDDAPDVPQRNGIVRGKVGAASRSRTGAASGPRLGDEGGDWSVDVRVGGKGYIVVWTNRLPDRSLPIPPRLLDVLLDPQLSKGSIVAEVEKDGGTRRRRGSEGTRGYGGSGSGSGGRGGEADDPGGDSSGADDEELGRAADAEADLLATNRFTESFDDRQVLALANAVLVALGPPLVGAGTYEMWRDAAWGLADLARQHPTAADQLRDMWIAWSASVPGAPSQTELRRRWVLFAEPRLDGPVLGFGSLIHRLRQRGVDVVELVERARRASGDGSGGFPSDVDTRFIVPNTKALNATGKVRAAQQAVRALIDEGFCDLGIEVMTRREVVRFDRSGPWWDPDQWEPLERYHQSAIIQQLRLRCPTITNVSLFNEAIDVWLRQNLIDGPLGWLDSLRGQWDGVPRLDRWLVEMGVPDSPLARYGGKLLVLSIVGRQLYPGSKVDECLVLAGPAGIGKTLLGRTLVPFSAWFCEGLEFDVCRGDKELFERTSKAIVVELAEFHNLNRSMHSKLKAWVSAQHTIVRPAYGRHAQEFHRRFAIYGTTNSPESVVAMNDSGRRFLVLDLYAMTRPLDIDWLRDHRDQIFAEALDWMKVVAGSTRYPSAWWQALREEEPQLYLDAVSSSHEVIKTSTWDLIADIVCKNMPTWFWVETSRILEATGVLDPFDNERNRINHVKLRDALRNAGLDVCRHNSAWVVRHRQTARVKNDDAKTKQRRRLDEDNPVWKELAEQLKAARNTY